MFLDVAYINTDVFQFDLIFLLLIYLKLQFLHFLINLEKVGIWLALYANPSRKLKQCLMEENVRSSILFLELTPREKLSVAFYSYLTRGGRIQE